jgi:protein involved in polysaccharide export with SLBB domain
VIGEKELSLEFAVPGEGSVQYPLLGAIEVEGRTVSQLSREIAGRLSRYLVEPVLQVSVSKWRDRKIYVYGASEKSRALTLSPGEQVTLSQLLIAMGVSRATTDLGAVTVIRPQASGKKEIVAVDLLRVFENFELDKDLVLRHNDLVVLQDNPKVYIQGEVKQSGPVSFADSREMTLTKLLAKVGPGASADLGKIQIVRGKGKDAKIFQASGSGKQVRLEPEDVVTVPARRECYATIYGEVKRPGTVKLPEGQTTRISTVIALAGGTTEYASSTINLFRYSEEGKSQKFSLDFDEVAAGQPEHDVEVEPGDTVYIGASIW